MGNEIQVIDLFHMSPDNIVVGLIIIIAIPITWSVGHKIWLAIQNALQNDLVQKTPTKETLENQNPKSLRRD